MEYAPFDQTRPGACRTVARQGPRVHAGLRHLARHWHGRAGRARDLHPRDHGAGARHQHQRADRAPGAPARSAPRQSRRVGARAVVVSGLSGVARHRYRYGHHRLGQGVQRIRRADSGRRGAPRVADAVRVAQLLQHVRRVARARTGIRSRDRRRAIGRAARRVEPRFLAEPDGVRSRHRREIRHARWRPAYGGRDRAATTFAATFTSFKRRAPWCSFPWSGTRV